MAVRKVRPGAGSATLAAALLVGFAAAPAPAAAREGSHLTEQQVVRDRSGSQVGRMDRQSDGDLILRNRNGNRVGRLQSTGDGGYIVRNQQGFHTGMISRAR